MMRNGVITVTTKISKVNLCVLLGETSKLPIYQTVYSGSLKDVSTFEATLKKFEKITDGRKVTIVMDKGFYSQFFQLFQAFARMRPWSKNPNPPC
jgi:hypothetical protein